ncbi:SDR family NAD(P)-dependent oxidoreductase [Actinoplanes sp. NPDC048796]|uniref:SDR family oxidoreductase n=1 Tax=unclassified Actinoplanes TaxID=2626549 RepID=UPI0033C45408
MTLTGRVHVVAGGTGRAGTAVVRELISRGAVVAVPSRNPSRLARLQDKIQSDLLHGFVGDISDLPDSTRLRSLIAAELGPIDAVVASLGEWWEGAPLAGLDPAVWQRIISDNLTSHFMVARVFLPALAGRADSVYLALGGIASVLAVAGSGPISVTGAAQAMLMRVLAAENESVRLHEVDVYTPIVTEDWDGGAIEPGWLSGRDVGAFVADALTPGFKGELFLPIPADTTFRRNEA